MLCGILTYLKAQMAKSIHVRFDSLNLGLVDIRYSPQRGIFHYDIDNLVEKDACISKSTLYINDGQEADRSLAKLFVTSSIMTNKRYIDAVVSFYIIVIYFYPYWASTGQ